MSRAVTVTSEQLTTLPHDGCRMELVEGEVRRRPLAGCTHGRVSISVGARLAAHVADRALGTVFAAETGFLLARDPDTVRAPDVAFVTRERVEAVGETDGYFPGAPDLAVEVVSPSDPYQAVVEKVKTWLAAGTRTVVVVTPRLKAVTVHAGKAAEELGEADTLDLSPVVPGFRLPVRVLFD